MLLVNRLAILLIPSLIIEPERIFDMCPLNICLSCASFGKLYFYFYKIVYIKFMRTELYERISNISLYFFSSYFPKSRFEQFFLLSDGETT